MKQSKVLRYVILFTQWYVLMILAAIGLDYVLHYFHLPGVGRALGYAGTLLLIVSFIYSLRKRRILKEGSPRKWLMFHEYLAWMGSVLLLVHAGIHINAIIPKLAVVMLLINVASGLVGKFLLRQSIEHLEESKLSLAQTGLDPEGINRKLFFDSILVESMKHWRTFHLPIAFLFGLFSLLHILTIFIFGK